MMRVVNATEWLELLAGAVRAASRNGTGNKKLHHESKRYRERKISPGIETVPGTKNFTGSRNGTGVKNFEIALLSNQ